jgi:hypothetical protein
MKKTLLFILLIAAFAACNKTVYVPVETARTEYRDNYLRDSIHLTDSIFVKIKGDTVRIEKYRNLYVDRLKRDSIFLNDTVRVPYPVEGNCVSGRQNIRIWTGRILADIPCPLSGRKG